LRIVYIRVQPGENLSAVAALFGTTAEAVLQANGLRSPEAVRPGSVLRVPRSPESPMTAGRATAELPHPGQLNAIALTFEASSGRGNTAAVLECLRRQRVRATWFLTGEWAERFPRLAREIVRDGHQVELHGHRHLHLRELSPLQLKDEILRSASVVRALSGVKPRFLRPPFGSASPAVTRLARELGYRVVLEAVDSLDWQNPGAGEIVARVLAKARPGAVVLMHTSADQTPAALAGIIPGLLSAGYELQTLDQLLAGGVPAGGSRARTTSWTSDPIARSPGGQTSTPPAARSPIRIWP